MPRLRSAKSETGRTLVSPVRVSPWFTPYRLPGTNALKSLSLEVPTAFTE